MSKIRIGILGLLVASAFVLAWTLPAGARQATTTTRVTVLMGKPTTFSFRLSRAKVPHGVVIFTLKNVDSAGLTHNFDINKHISKPVLNGKTATLRVVFSTAGKYPYLCTVPGHADSGMKGTLTVT